MGTYGAPIYLTSDITAFQAYGGGYHLLNKDDIYCGKVLVRELAAIPEVAALVEAAGKFLDATNELSSDSELWQDLNAKLAPFEEGE